MFGGLGWGGQVWTTPLIPASAFRTMAKQAAAEQFGPATTERPSIRPLGGCSADSLGGSLLGH